MEQTIFKALSKALFLICVSHNKKLEQQTNGRVSYVYKYVCVCVCVCAFCFITVIYISDSDLEVHFLVDDSNPDYSHFVKQLSVELIASMRAYIGMLREWHVSFTTFNGQVIHSLSDTQTVDDIIHSINNDWEYGLQVPDQKNLRVSTLILHFVICVLVAMNLW